MENTPTLNNTPYRLPVIDIRPLSTPDEDRDRVAAQIGQACREQGFFYVIGHEVDVCTRDLRDLRRVPARQGIQGLPAATAGGIMKEGLTRDKGCSVTAKE
ncbi:MAG: 2-oxoglutarate and iron-dependent oxygenase domain-containing protein [Gammaproteobacteria bacterium]